MKITVIDGQGGRVGSSIIKALRENSISAEIFAIGTNSIATSTMMKAGANFGATGENPVIVASKDSDIIVGPIGIVVADSLFGEVTPQMAVAIGQSNAHKVLLPVSKCRIHTIYNKDKSTAEIIKDAIDVILEIISEI